MFAVVVQTPLLNDRKNIPNSLRKQIVFKNNKQPNHTLGMRSTYRPVVTAHGCTSNTDRSAVNNP